MASSGNPYAEHRTETISTRVTEEEYKDFEAIAQAKGVRMSEWVREVLLAERQRGATPTAETILAEILALRMLYLNTVQTLGAGRAITTEEMRKLMAWVDEEKYRKVAQMVDKQAARKKSPRAEASGNGSR
jgi:hypothetical protein